jgi:hypothetical protein
MPVYHWPTKDPDGIPRLRSSARHAPPRVYKNSPRRDRLIYKAIRRSNRRWDLYAALVKSGQLQWEVSSKTREWRLVLENGKLLEKFRKLEYMLERRERLEL